MANRLEPINVLDFTGGLNLRSSQFQLADNETPEALNITVDPLGGIYTRRGWECWNHMPIVEEGEHWDPRRAYLHQLNDGIDVIYVAANGTVFAAGVDRMFEDLLIPCSAATHMIDWASIGNVVYMACGHAHDSYKRDEISAPVALTPSGSGNWNDDYATPVGGVMPRANLCEAHAGYLFVAHLSEDGIEFPNRVRWSHPTSVEDWAQLDYIDIGDGGAEITGMMSYEDHLLIFKNDSVWALYGYETESWQLVKKSSTVGAVGPQSITRNEQVVYFHSGSDRGGIYVYGGERPVEVSTPIERAFEDVLRPELIWVGWLSRQLWVTMPWTYDGPAPDSAATFVFDPDIGESGAWMYYASTEGALGPVVAGSNTDTQFRPMAVLRGEIACLVQLDARDDASDRVSEVAVIGISDVPLDWEMGYLTLEDGVTEIIADGAPGVAPFRTAYRTGWVNGGWPTRRKSFRRPDFVCRVTGTDHALEVASFRDYDERRARRQSRIDIFGGGSTRWGEFEWGDGSAWGSDVKGGAEIRRGSSFGMCRALQLRIAGMTPGARWGIDAFVLKLVMRRFH